MEYRSFKHKSPSNYYMYRKIMELFVEDIYAKTYHASAPMFQVWPERNGWLLSSLFLDCFLPAVSCISFTPSFHFGKVETKVFFCFFFFFRLLQPLSATTYTPLPKISFVLILYRHLGFIILYGYGCIRFFRVKLHALYPNNWNIHSGGKHTHTVSKLRIVLRSIVRNFNPTCFIKQPQVHLNECFL